MRVTFLTAVHHCILPAVLALGTMVVWGSGVVYAAGTGDGGGTGLVAGDGAGLVAGDRSGSLANMVISDPVLFTLSPAKLPPSIQPGEIARYVINLHPDVVGSSADRGDDGTDLSRIKGAELSGASAEHLKSGARILLPLPTGDFAVDLIRVEEPSASTGLWIGRQASSGGLFALSSFNGRVAGRIHDVDRGATYQVYYDQDLDGHVLAQLDPTRLDALVCGAEGVDRQNLLDLRRQKQLQTYGVLQEQRSGVPGSSPEPKIRALGAEPRTDVHSPPPFSEAVLVDTYTDTTTIDVMAVYTQAAQTYAETCTPGGGCTGGGTIDSYILTSLALSQAAIDNSELPIRLRLVHTHKTTYNELSDGVNSVTRLQRFTGSPSFPDAIYNWDPDRYMDEIHAKRDSAGADLVVGYFDINDVGGIAWILNYTPGFPEIGFSLNRIRQVANTYTVLHEIGHNLGNDHSRTQTSNPAGLFAGLFHYSAGYQFTASGVGYATVMGYTQSAYPNEAPLFSSPLLNWNGAVAAQTADLTRPTDARQNNLHVKQAVAANRVTRIQPPSASVGASSLSATLKPGRTTQLTLPISNGGESDLMWSVRVSAADPAKRRTGQEVPEVLAVVRGASGNAGGSTEMSAERGASQALARLNGIAHLHASTPLNASVGMAIADDITPFSEPITGQAAISSGDSVHFEDFESFAIAAQAALSGWRTSSTSRTFSISGSNPSQGARHLRLQPAAANWSLKSPFFGPLSPATFEITVDVRITPDPANGAFNRFDIVFYDGSTAGISSGVVFFGDSLYTYAGSNSFTNSGRRISTDGYFSLGIRYDLAQEQIIYLMDGTAVSTRPYAEGSTPDHIEFFVYTGASNASLYDIDELLVRQPYTVSWLDVADHGGTIRSGSTGQLVLDLDAEGLAAGTYSVDVEMMSNDPAAESTTIPVSLQVVERYLSLTVPQGGGFRMMSSPNSGAVLGDLLAETWTQGMTGADTRSGSPNVWTHDGREWTAVSDLNSHVLGAGEGFLTYVFEDANLDGSSSTDFPLTLSVGSGVANLGNVSRAATYTADQGGVAGSGWNLFGNPFDEALDALAMFGDNTSGFQQAIYVYDDSIDDFVSYNSLGAGDLANGLIAPFQGFFIQSTGQGQTFSFATDATVADPATFYRGTGSVAFGYGPKAGAVSESPSGADSPRGSSAPRGADSPRGSSAPRGTDSPQSTGTLVFTALVDSPQVGSEPLQDRLHLSFSPSGRVGMDPDDAFKLLPLQRRDRLAVVGYDVEGLGWTHGADKEAGAGGINSAAEAGRSTYDILNLPLNDEGDIVAGFDILALAGSADQTSVWNSPGPNEALSDSAHVTLTWSWNGVAQAFTSAVLVDFTLNRTFNLLEEEPIQLTLPILMDRFDSAERMYPPTTSTPRFGVRFRFPSPSTGNRSEAPIRYTLAQNVPNPFNPSTQISFSLPKAEHATLEIFDVTGRRVATLVDGTLPAGEHTVEWGTGATGRVPSGLYLYRLRTPGFTSTKKMMLVK